MKAKRTLLVACLAAVSLYGCGGASDSKVSFDKDAVAAAPVFDPSNAAMPLPNDILFSQETAGDGTMYAGNDPGNPVITGIDHLDGASVLAHIDIKFDDSLNPDQDLDATPFIAGGGSYIPNPNQNVFLIPLRYPSGDPLDNTGEIPTLAPAFDYQVAVAKAQSADAGTQAEGIAELQALATPEARATIISLDGGVNNVLRITPLQPLQPRTKYLVVITKDIETASGDPVGESTIYTLLSDENFVFSEPAQQALQAAVLGWETLAAGYYSFLDTVFETVGVTSDVNRGIALSYTFTTGDPQAVLRSIAAPNTFFEESITTTAKKEAIAKLVDGTLNLNGDNTGIADPTDQQINTVLNGLLTNTSSPLYVADFANAINAGVLTTFADVANDATLAHIAQLAAANAGVTVEDTDGQTIAQEADTNVANLSALDLLPMPESRPTNFYRFDCTGSAETGCNSPLHPSLQAPGFVAQGNITLPYYLVEPASEDDGTNMVFGTWTADSTLAGAMSVSLPSDKVTYRFPFPKKNADLTVPILAVYPDETVLAASGQSKPAQGWPVIIYQHGITTNRGVTLPFANAMAFACVDPTDITLTTPSGLDCFVTIAIDQPLHGVPPEGSFGLSSVDDPDVTITPNIGDNTVPAELGERHFNFTASENPTVPVPMDYVADTGSSGSLFSNLVSFPTGRDNLRQGAVDILNVIASLKDMDLDDDGNPDLDTSRVFFIGHSLGAVDGIPALAINNRADVQAGNPELEEIKAASLINTGGFVTQLLLNSHSENFGAPAILRGLAANGLLQKTSDLEIFTNILQANLDSGDAMNFAASLAEGDATGLVLMEVIGGDTVEVPTVEDPEVTSQEVSVPDQTIPNDADETIWTVTGLGPLNKTFDDGFVVDSFPTPLAGTEPLYNLMDPVKTADVTPGFPVRAITRFTRGSHGNPVTAGVQQVGGEMVDRWSDFDVFIEMVIQTATLFTADGANVGVVNTEVVED